MPTGLLADCYRIATGFFPFLASSISVYLIIAWTASIRSKTVKQIPTWNFEYSLPMSLGWKQQIVNILPSQKFSFCGKHKCCQFLSVDGNIRKIVLGSEKGVFEDYIVPNETSIQFELRILDFFQDPHFFPKKWLINIYCTCQKYTSLRKYHSSF